MEDTDWRPSPCPNCGLMRKAARNPICVPCELNSLPPPVVPSVADYKATLEQIKLTTGQEQISVKKIIDTFPLQQIIPTRITGKTSEERNEEWIRLYHQIHDWQSKTKQEIIDHDEAERRRLKSKSLARGLFSDDD